MYLSRRAGGDDQEVQDIQSRSCPSKDRQQVKQFTEAGLSAGWMGFNRKGGWTSGLHNAKAVKKTPLTIRYYVIWDSWMMLRAAHARGVEARPGSATSSNG